MRPQAGAQGAAECGELGEYGPEHRPEHGQERGGNGVRRGAGGGDGEEEEEEEALASEPLSQEEFFLDSRCIVWTSEVT